MEIEQDKNQLFLKGEESLARFELKGKMSMDDPRIFFEIKVSAGWLETKDRTANRVFETQGGYHDGLEIKF